MIDRASTRSSPRGDGAQLAELPGVRMQLLHCTCGATRQAPVSMSIVSCVRCGAAMGLASKVASVPAPRRTLVGTATFASQLLGTAVFVLGLVWIVALRTTTDVVFGALVASAILVLAGGHAHRGGVIALASCATFDLAIGIALLLKIPPAITYAEAPIVRISDALARHHELVITITGIAAVVCAIACVAALGQARRFAAWQREHLHHLAHFPPNGLVARLEINRAA